MTYRLLLCLALLFSLQIASAASPIKIGLNYPESGRYQYLGLQQRLGAFLAVEEINAQGGVLGRPLELVIRNTRLKPDRGAQNVVDMIEKENVQMIFGGVSSAVAIASGKAAKERDRIYFGTLTYANATTGKAGHTHMFRESYNAWMTASALGQYLASEYQDKRFFYITADYTWGYSVEESLRTKSGTEDTERHPVARTPFPNARTQDFYKALEAAEASEANVLVLVLGGGDMVRAVNIIHEMGLKEKMDIIWPNTSLGTAIQIGPALMQGIIGAAPWFWELPYEKGYQPGIDFVENFSKSYDMRPSSAAASAYSIVYQYRDAVERAGTTRTADVIQALEGHRYSLLKDTQEWRAFDHQNVQSVYVVRMKPRDQVLADEYNSDFYEILATIDGSDAARTLEEWQEDRRKAGAPLKLQ
ncbi:ABC transporter substrate-binding protein [Marinobacter nanhaiticus D15-8W]|uniref:ABC transporter substrate-binding protein n=1 Tax=Marinobacter nanhaiticus D15-8W TaxID=626887 RepID=N6WN56_9GAMM|nr:ABC transporter substrate-binding protein [Marinobacter nanhaiticus]ENO12941.1 ABC transporter substrate-binding protein [Marinobacter nanhaiticus D15-8W]BES70293.1 ABC transporter substrate-binding protein [Marinobacter nanhaiticus D15-8W]